MKLADALRGLPERSLGPYRTVAGLPAAGIAELVARLSDPERVAHAVHTLPPGPLLALRILWFHTAPNMAPWLFHTVFISNGGATGADRAVETLVEQAILVPPLSAGGQYVIAEEIRPTLLQLVMREWLPTSGFYLPAGEVPLQIHATDPAAVVSDFVRVLGVLPAGIRVRQQDILPYQADQRRLSAALDRSALPALPPLVPGAIPWEGYAPEVGPLFSVAVAFGLVEAREGVWTDSSRVLEWVNLPPEVQWSGLLQVWATLCATHLDDPLARGVYDCLRSGVWCRPAALARWLAQFTTSGQHRLVAAVHNVIVAFGVRVGALEWGHAANVAAPASAADGGRPEPVPAPEDCAVRLRPEAAHALAGNMTPLDFPRFDEAPLAQGTFEILTGPRTPPALVWLLESWAEREAVDRFTTYRLTRRSVGAAARRAGCAEDLLNALAGSPGGVPQNVDFSIREWAAEVVHLTAELALILRCADETAAERAARTGAFRGCERLGPTAWRVPADRAGTVWRALTDAGCDVEGNLQDFRDRLAGRLHRPVRTDAPPPQLPWPGVPHLPLPTPTAHRQSAAGHGMGEKAPAQPSDVRPHTPTRTVPRPEPVRNAPRLSPRSLGDTLPVVMRLTRREVCRALQRGMRLGRPVGLADTAGGTHVLIVQDLTADSVAGYCTCCHEDHRLPLRTIAATVRP